MLIIKKRDNTIMLQSGRINNLHHIIYIWGCGSFGVVGVSGAMGVEGIFGVLQKVTF